MLDVRTVRKTRRFILEGLRAVGESIAAHGNGEYPVEEVFVDVVFAEKPQFKRLLEIANRKYISVSAIKYEFFEKICASETPQGIFAVLGFPKKSDSERLGSLLNAKSCVLFLDGVQDPGNCGTLIRCAAAFDCSGVIIGGNTAKLFNPKVIRSTAGTFLHIPTLDLSEKDPLELLGKFAANGFEIVATTMDGTDCRTTDIKRKTVLIVGNEGAGIQKRIVDFAHKKISVPISPKVESLNASVAGSILLYEFARAQQR